MMNIPFIFSTKSRRLSTKLISCICIVSIAISGTAYKNNEQSEQNEQDELYGPNDYFYLARTYPDAQFSLQAYKNAMQYAANDYTAGQDDARGAEASWQIEGPTNIGGRINAIAIDPDNTSIILEGCASGGIFKSIDGGLNWYPVFDDFSYLAIATIVYDPTNSNIIYAGTGDVNISGYPFIGDGIYKSTDGGESWTHIGLTEACIISKIIVHPSNHNIIYAAAMGLPFERNYDRGLYKSIDGGATWNQILSISDQAGVIDIVSNADDPDIIYAAGWDRIRNNSESIVSGSGSKLFKSINGGTTWNVLDEDNGLPATPNSRISIEMDPDNNAVLYASYVGTDLNLHGIYKSTNSGSSWSSLSISGIESVFNGFGWYNDGIQLNPYNPDELFVEGVDLYVTNNDGDSWTMATPEWWLYQVHADKHGMAFTSASHYYVATDGGSYKTTNDGDSWTDADEIPNSQFYHIEINPHQPGVYWGGLQDNGTTSGNIGYVDSWPRIYGGDGFHSEFRSDADNIYYVETQNCGIAVFDGFNYYDATTGIDLGADRTNWNTPYIISKHNPDILYAGTYRVYKSTTGVYPDYNAISGDLTDGVPDLPMFHTLTVIEQSDFSENVLYVGSTDGNVNRTTSGGASWTNISAGLPDRYVTDIAVSHTDENTVYVANSGYKDNEFIPHIHKSIDKGNTWIDISGDLPQLAVNALVIYPTNDDYIFAATDGGVYFTINGGIHWERLGNNMPAITVYDLEYDQASNKIIAGTFARSCWSISLDGVLPLIITADNDVAICAGDEVTLHASGGVVYTWSPEVVCDDGSCSTVTVSPSVTTTYTVTGFDALGNSSTDDIIVVVNPLPAEPVITQDGTYLITIPEVGLTYQWYKDGSPLIGETNDTLTLVAAESGNFTVTVSNEFGCSASSSIYIVQAGIETANNIQLNIYPNPAHDFIQLQLSQIKPHETINYSIVNMEGKIIVEGIFYNEPINIIPIKQLSTGIYMIYVQHDHKKGILKLVKI